MSLHLSNVLRAHNFCRRAYAGGAFTCPGPGAHVFIICPCLKGMLWIKVSQTFCAVKIVCLVSLPAAEQFICWTELCSTSSPILDVVLLLFYLYALMVSLGTTTTCKIKKMQLWWLLNEDSSLTYDNDIFICWDESIIRTIELTALRTDLFRNFEQNTFQICLF